MCADVDVGLVADDSTSCGEIEGEILLLLLTMDTMDEWSDVS